MLAREQVAAHLTPARDGRLHACTSQEASTPSESSGFQNVAVTWHNGRSVDKN